MGGQPEEPQHLLHQMSGGTRQGGTKLSGARQVQTQGLPRSAPQHPQVLVLARGKGCAMQDQNTVLKKENRHCGRRGQGCRAKRKRGGGTSKAGRVDPLPPLQSHAQQGMEARQLQRGEWQREVLFFSLWRQSLPLDRRRPFETLHLTSSHLGAE